MIWDVYKWTREPRTVELIGTVEGDGHVKALKVAAARWPDLACARPEYPSGRLVLRREGNVMGLPAKVIRS
jgi:hypothetical protein